MAFACKVVACKVVVRKGVVRKGVVRKVVVRKVVACKGAVAPPGGDRGESQGPGGGPRAGAATVAPILLAAAKLRVGAAATRSISATL